MFCIINQILAPLRSQNSETSEMLSQLLFGEFALVLEKQEKWLKVCNYADDYEGWIDRKMVEEVENFEISSLLNSHKKQVQSAFTIAENCSDSAEKLLLPGGSIIHDLDEKGVFRFRNKSYVVAKPADVDGKYPISGERILTLAKQYLNAPYLWGGKSIFGIDCSGLVQLVYSICGIQLPRDASQQVNQGKIVNFLSESETGDLAFFENKEGEIIHVGILINTRQIIHASACVKIENIDNEGIFSNEKQAYSHRLRVIKRIL